MKKQLFLSSALALVALASCGNNSKGGLKVGLICLHDKASTYDANFIGAFEAACKEAKQKGYIADYKYVTDVPEEGSGCAEAAERFVNQGYNVIFSDSFGHDPSMKEVAAKHPNVFFSSATGVLANNGEFLPNFHNAFASIYEGRYLAGVAAGKYLLKHGFADKNGVTVPLGYVGAYDYAEVISGYTSWYLGVKSQYKEAKVTMKVLYTGSWYDEVEEGNAATRLIDQEGCKLISQHADSMGAPNVCAAKEIPNVSYNMNTAEVSKVCEDTYVAHSRINWKPYYDAVLKTAIGTKFDKENNNWTGDLSTESVQYNVSSKLLDDADREDINKIAEQLKNEERYVFDLDEFKVNPDPNIQVHNKNVTIEGSGTTGKIATYTADTDGDYAPDKSLIADGKSGKKYICESFFRSAPSFDLIIDGIEELNHPKP